MRRASNTVGRMNTHVDREAPPALAMPTRAVLVLDDTQPGQAPIPLHAACLSVLEEVYPDRFTVYGPCLTTATCCRPLCLAPVTDAALGLPAPELAGK